MDTGRHGPIAASIYIGGHAYRVLGGRNIKFSGTASFPDGTADPSGDGIRSDVYKADFEWQADKWIYRAGIGLRFHWLGR